MLRMLLILLLFFNHSFADPSPKPLYQVCFTPGENCTGQIVDVINRAKASVFVQAYSFTSVPIANALIAAKNRNVDVQIILDKSQKKFPSHAVKRLAAHGITLEIDDKPAIAHNKVMIIDHQKVITGSFNFTFAAQKHNAENVLMIDDSRLADQYFHNWQTRFRQSTILDQDDITEDKFWWLTVIIDFFKGYIY